MYQEVGKYISEKSKEASYGSNYVENVADFFSENYPDLKGFTRRGLYRLKQFYELYKDDEKVSTLLTQLRDGGAFMRGRYQPSDLRSGYHG